VLLAAALQHSALLQHGMRVQSFGWPAGCDVDVVRNDTEYQPAAVQQVVA